MSNGTDLSAFISPSCIYEEEKFILPVWARGDAHVCCLCVQLELCVSAVRCVFNASGIALHYPKDPDMSLERKATVETPPPNVTSAPLADG